MAKTGEKAYKISIKFINDKNGKVHDFLYPTKLEIGSIIYDSNYYGAMEVVGVLKTDLGLSQNATREWLNISEITSPSTFSTQSNSNSKKQAIMKNSSNSVLSSLFAKMKSQFIPTQIDDLRLSMNGEIVVNNKEGWVGMDKSGELISYPEEMTVKVPMFTIAKPKAQLLVGDVVRISKTYYSVTAITEKGLRVTSFLGTDANKKMIKDAILGQQMITTVVNMFAQSGFKGFNPMMMLALQDGDSSNVMEMMMMTQLMNNGGSTQTQMNPMMFMMMSDSFKEGGNSAMEMMLLSQMMGQGEMSNQMNPMMMMLLMKGENGGNSDMVQMMMMQQMMGQGGTNPFDNLFNIPVQAQPVAPTANDFTEVIVDDATPVADNPATREYTLEELREIVALKRELAKLDGKVAPEVVKADIIDLDVIEEGIADA